MGTLITNRIVTRGMGPSRGVPGRAGLPTQGYGGFKRTAEIEDVTRRILYGPSKEHRRVEELYEEFTIHAKLISVNKKDVRSKDIKGSIKIRMKKGNIISIANVKYISTTIRKIMNNILIKVERLKYGKSS